MSNDFTKLNTKMNKVYRTIQQDGQELLQGHSAPPLIGPEEYKII